MDGSYDFGKAVSSLVISKLLCILIKKTMRLAQFFVSSVSDTLKTEQKNLFIFFGHRLAVATDCNVVSLNLHFFALKNRLKSRARFCIFWVIFDRFRTELNPELGHRH